MPDYYSYEDVLSADVGSPDYHEISTVGGAEIMAIPVLTTKLSVPPIRHDWVARPRLIKQLDQGLGRKLTLISAPAGFGKTTLITSWLHRLDDRQQQATCIAWLSLEEDDNFPIRFMTHFIAALQRIDPGIGQTVQALLELPRIPKLNHL